MEAFVENTDAAIAHIGSAACYLPEDDVIYMPDPESFVTTASGTATEGYYATLSHQLVHWTGHITRLKREQFDKFGSEEYAREELVGELGAAFL